MSPAKPLNFSASAFSRYSRCPFSYRLHYVDRLTADKQDQTKLIISKIVHLLGSQWAIKSHADDWELFVKKTIHESIHEIEPRRIQYALGTIPDLLNRYIDLLRRLDLSNISIEEAYGSSFTQGIPISEYWSFTGAADVVIFNDKIGDAIYDAKWTWNPEGLSRTQINIYATAHESILKRPISKTGFICFGPQKIVEFRFDEVVRRETIDLLDTTIRKILDGNFTPDPHYDKCLYCDFKSKCEHKLITSTEEELSNDGCRTEESTRNVLYEPL